MHANKTNKVVRFRRGYSISKRHKNNLKLIIMKTLLKLAEQINGKVNPLKYGKNKDKGFCITDKDNNEILTVSPSYGTGFKWSVINRNCFENTSLTYINRLTELKGFKLNAGFNGNRFKN